MVTGVIFESLPWSGTGSAGCELKFSTNQQIPTPCFVGVHENIDDFLNSSGDSQQ
jgi:hypothetical protein